jgi:ribosomal protein S12 methylthiotransferase
MNKEIVDVVSLGCSKNLVDSEQLMRQFDVLGYDVRHDNFKGEGNVVVINTCGFIGDAKEESVNTILQFAELKKHQKIQKLFVMGCLSERYLNELKVEIPEVDKFYGKFNFTEIVKELGQELRADLRLERKLTTPSHFAYLKISEGCNRTCSYCAIPIMTGKHRSRPMEEIEAEVKGLVKQGVKEFNVIAQDLSYYGIDRYKTSKLAELLEKLSDIEGVKWIRLHYAYPSDFPYDILKIMRERDNICKYLDIALQHISDRMLKLMRRGITKAETYELIERIRKEVPGIHIRTTLLVGHPGEMEEDFEELKTFVKDIRFERMGAFTYSNEDGTYAYEKYNDEIPEEIKQERLNEIMFLQQQVSSELGASKVGKVLNVLVDRIENEYYVGRTQFDSPEVDPEVLIPIDTPNVQVGAFYQAEIIDANDFDLFGK